MKNHRNVAQDINGNAILGATVTIKDAATGTALPTNTIYSTNTGTPKTNPFTASTTDGEFEFYAANGRYTVSISATGYTGQDYDILLEETITKSTKAEVAALFFSQYDDGTKVFITSDDGGPHTVRYNATPATYADDGGSYCGTQFIPAGGDGTIGIVRDVYDNRFNAAWFNLTPSNTAADNDAAFAVALAALSDGDELIFQGDYEISAAVSITKSIWLVGIPYAGTEPTGGITDSTGTWIRFDSTATAADMITFTPPDTSNQLMGGGTRGISIDGANKATRGLVFKSSRYQAAEEPLVIRCTVTQIEINSDGAGSQLVEAVKLIRPHTRVGGDAATRFADGIRIYADGIQATDSINNGGTSHYIEDALCEHRDGHGIRIRETDSCYINRIRSVIRPDHLSVSESTGTNSGTITIAASGDDYTLTHNGGQDMTDTADSWGAEEGKVLEFTATNTGNNQDIRFWVRSINAGGDVLTCRLMNNDTPTAETLTTYTLDILPNGVRFDKPAGKITAGGSITSVSNAGNTYRDHLVFTCSGGHNINEDYKTILVSGTTNYDGYYVARRISATVFEVQATWVATNTGTVEPVFPASKNVIAHNGRAYVYSWWGSRANIIHDSNGEVSSLVGDGVTHVNLMNRLTGESYQSKRYAVNESLYLAPEKFESSVGSANLVAAGDYLQWRLAPGSTESVAVTISPDTWNDGIIEKVEIFATPIDANSGDVVWQLEIKSRYIDEQFGVTPSELTDTDTTDTMSLSATANQQLHRLEFATSHLLRNGDLTTIQISRVGGDGSDTYAVDVAYIGARITYRAKGPGFSDSSHYSYMPRYINYDRRA